MLEIAFSRSVQGCLRVAQHCGLQAILGVSLICKDGTQSTRPELRAARRQAEQEARHRQAEAVPLGGTARDVYGFPLCLSVGPIAGEPLGPERKAILTRLCRAVNPRGEAKAEALLTQAVEQFRSLLERMAQEEPLRVWYSEQPDERCGLSWLCWELQRRGIRAPVYLMSLPQLEQRTDGTLIRYSGWGEIEPDRFSALLSHQREAGPVLQTALAREWEQLRQKNGPLRAVVNGRLCTVPEDFYDCFLRQALADQPEEFHQGHVIGTLLSRDLPGISDCWLALRMEAMLENGELEQVSEAPADSPSYHRRLRKTALFRAKKIF